MAVPAIGTFANHAKFDRQDEPLDRSHKRSVNNKLDSIMAGRVNWVLMFTLATGASSTVVAADTITPNCQVSLDPMTPQAAALVGKIWISQVDRQPGAPSNPTQTGRLTLEHPVLNSGVVATFRASVKG